MEMNLSGKKVSKLKKATCDLTDKKEGNNLKFTECSESRNFRHVWSLHNMFSFCSAERVRKKIFYHFNISPLRSGVIGERNPDEICG